MTRPRVHHRAALVGLVAISLIACGPPRVTVSSEQPTRTTAASPNPSATAPSPTQPPATPEAPPPIEGNVLAAPGAIAIANIEPTPAGAWQLSVDVVQRDGSITSGSIDFGVPDGWEPRTRLGRVRLTQDGWAAIEIDLIDDQSGAENDDAVIVINVLGEGRASGVLPGSAPIWLPDGTLLMNIGAEEIVRRIAEHGSGAVMDLELSGAPPRPLFPLRNVVEADISGLVGFQDDVLQDPEYVTILWDGTTIPRSAADPPFLSLGSERLAGARGDATENRVECHFQDDCPLNWRRPNGREFEIPGVPWAISWTRDGEALVIFEGEPAPELGGSQLALVDVVEGHLIVEPLAEVPPEGMTGGIYWIGGMSDWAAVVEHDEDQVTVIPLDGSPAIGPLRGWLAAVNP